MEKEMFNELLESVQEMDEILGGKKQASSSFDFSNTESEITSECLKKNPPRQL